MATRWWTWARLVGGAAVIGVLTWRVGTGPFLDGVRSVDWVLLNTARTFGLSRAKTILQVVLPAASPQVMTGLRVSLPITLILVVISEMVGSTDGIGYFILDSQRRFKVAQMYAGMLSLAILGYTLNQLFNLMHRVLMSWHWGMMRRME